MSKVAVMITDMFEDDEYAKPAAAFTKAGHQLVHVGLKAGATVKGVKKGTPVKVEKTAREVKVADFDALFIPGGYSPDRLRVDEDVVKWARDFVKSGKPVCLICHAAQLLITAQALKGRKVTGWKSIIQDIKNAGAEFLDQEVVEDGNLVSSRSPADLPAFIKACLKRLK
jgi:protease I